MKVRISEDEEYPVYSVSEAAGDAVRAVNIRANVVRRYAAAREEWDRVQAILRRAYEKEEAEWATRQRA